MMRIKRKPGSPVLRQNREGELEYLTFQTITETGVADHLFSTRLGGVSEGCLGTMNLSYGRGDEKERVDENFRRIAAVLQREAQDFVCSDQTHTANIRTVTGADRGKGVTRPRDYQDVDGLVTNERGLVLATFYADCVPLYFVDPVRRAIGLAHAGWRGTAAGIGARTVERMGEEYGSRPQDIITAIGPSICQDCYEIGEDVAEIFRERCGAAQDILRKQGGGKYRLNLWRANERVLLDAGILPEHISVTDICTCCNPQYLFSHRASQGKRGNLGAFLCLK